MIELSSLSIQTAHQALKRRSFSVKELVEAYLKEISSKNKPLNVYLEIFSDALQQANQAQKRFDSGQATLLTGIPLAIKDNILIEGKTATAGSKILSGFVSPYDATAISSLKGEGAVFLGRTNMDEFAMGSSTENSAFGLTHNPHDPSRVAGGSSGGSAAAVASNLALASLGSDTGGSVRQPASFCGVVGLKPTYGAVSRYGLIALGSSLDQIGPIGKSVSDVEIVFNSIRGKDELDSTSAESSSEKQNPKVIGVPRELLSVGGIHPDVEKNFEESISKLSNLGYKIKDIKLPNIKYSLAVYYVIMPAEASSNLARYDGVKYGLHIDGKDLIEDYFLTRGSGFGSEPRRRIMLGTYVLSAGYYEAYYSKAVQVRSLITREFEEVFRQVDVIAIPTTPTPPFKIGEKAHDPLLMYLADIFTVPANIANLPAISLPSGHSKSSENSLLLPLGLQLIGRSFEEQSLFEVGKKFLGEL